MDGTARGIPERSRRAWRAARILGALAAPREKAFLSPAHDLQLSKSTPPAPPSSTPPSPDALCLTCASAPQPEHMAPLFTVIVTMLK